MSFFKRFSDSCKSLNSKLKSEQVLALSILLQCTACSLSIDVEPKYLGTQALDSGAAQQSDSELQADAITPRNDSDLVDQGESDLAILDQGGVELSDMMPAETELQINVNPRNELTIEAQETISENPNYEALPDYAGSFGDQAGEMAGEMAGEIAGEVAAGMAPVEVIDSPIQTQLPIENCVIYDVLNDRCLQQLSRSRETVCADWQAHYEMMRPLPWSGDRSTCQVGTYHEQGYDDFERLLNLYRRLLNLNEVEVNTNSTLKECALAHDVVNRDQLTSFDTNANCYSAIREQAYNINNRITLMGSWSLYNALHTTFGLTRFNQDLSISFPIRQYMLSPSLNQITVGGRGRAVCMQTTEVPSSAPLNLVTVPAPGENPFALLKDGNHNGRVPWSFTITEGLAVNPQFTLSKLMGENFIEVAISIGEAPSDTGEIGFFFTPQEAPEASVLYRLDVSWESESGMNHYQIFSMLGLCGLGQPDECTPLPDSCILNGSHCALINIGTADEHWGCVWDGPIELGSSCEGLGALSCNQGTCVSFNEGPQVCAKSCDTQVPDIHANSCTALCPNGFANTGAYGICP